MTRSIGMICLCVFLLLFGIAEVTNITVVAMNVIRGLAAIAASILLLIGK